MIYGLCYMIAISCSQPRLEFREFYHQACHSQYPGLPYEMASTVQHRIADGVSAYMDYVVRYQDQCTFPVGQKGDKQ